MDRIDLLAQYLDEKHKTTIAHEQYLNTIREYAPGTDLYMREVHFLVAAGEKWPVSISALAEKLDVTLGAVSQMASKLEKKGFVYRSPDVEDKRRTMVNLTEEGIRMYRKHLEYDQKSLDLLSEAFHNFSEEELEKVIESERIFRNALQVRVDS